MEKKIANIIGLLIMAICAVAMCIYMTQAIIENTWEISHTFCVLSLFAFINISKTLIKGLQ